MSHCTKGFSCRTARVEEIVLLDSEAASDVMKELTVPWREVLTRSWIPVGRWVRSVLNAIFADAMVDRLLCVCLRSGARKKADLFFLWVCGAKGCLVAAPRDSTSHRRIFLLQPQPQLQLPTLPNHLNPSHFS